MYQWFLSKRTELSAYGDCGYRYLLQGSEREFSKAHRLLGSCPCCCRIGIQCWRCERCAVRAIQQDYRCIKFYCSADIGNGIIFKRGNQSNNDYLK